MEETGTGRLNVKRAIHDERRSAGAHGGFFGDDNDSSIEFSGLLAASGVQVQAQQFVLIEVELMTEWSALDGEIHLDAQSGSFKVSVPQLVPRVNDL